MRLLRPGPAQAEAGLRAMRQLAMARGAFGAASRALIDAAQRQVLHTDFNVDSLPPITAEELAAAFGNPALARQFVQGMTVVSLADGPPTEAQGRLIASYARALGVDEPAVRVMRELANHHTVLFRLDFMRRSSSRSASAFWPRRGWRTGFSQRSSAAPACRSTSPTAGTTGLGSRNRWRRPAPNSTSPRYSNSAAGSTGAVRLRACR